MIAYLLLCCIGATYSHPISTRKNEKESYVLKDKQSI